MSNNMFALAETTYKYTHTQLTTTKVLVSSYSEYCHPKWHTAAINNSLCPFHLPL